MCVIDPPWSRFSNYTQLLPLLYTVVLSACFMLEIAQSFFGLGQSADITIELEDVEKRKKVDVKNEDGKKEKLPLYLDGETVTGKVSTHTLSLPSPLIYL